MDPFFNHLVSPDLAELGGKTGTYFGYQDGDGAKLVIFTEKGQETFAISPLKNGCEVVTCIIPETYKSVDEFLKTHGFPSVIYETPDELNASLEFIKKRIWLPSQAKTLLNGQGGIEETDGGYQFVYRPISEGKERSPIRRTPFHLEDGEFVAGDLRAKNIVSLAHKLGIIRVTKFNVFGI